MCRVNNSLRDVLSFKYTHEIGLAIIVKMQSASFMAMTGRLGDAFTSTKEGEESRKEPHAGSSLRHGSIDQRGRTISNNDGDSGCVD